MKALSASIVVLAGAILLLGGSALLHSDTQLFVQSTGCIVGLAGLYGWFSCLRTHEKNDSFGGAMKAMD